MARRSRRAGRQVSHLDGGPQRAPFSLGVSPSASVGRAKPSWVSSVRRDLLRPVPLGLNDLVYGRPRRDQDVLRARRARITSTSAGRSAMREVYPPRLYRSLLPLAKPVLRKDHGVCVERKERKEVMFAAGVAGRRWNSRAGPVMRAARYTLKSFHSCRR